MHSESTLLLCEWLQSVTLTAQPLQPITFNAVITVCCSCRILQHWLQKIYSNYFNGQQVFRFAKCCLFRLWHSEFWHHAVLFRGYWCCERPCCFHLQSWRIRSKYDTDVIGVRMQKWTPSSLSWFWLATFLATELIQPNHILSFDHSSVKLGPNHLNLKIKMTGSSNMLLFTWRLHSVNIQKTSQDNGIFKLVHAIQCARGLHIRWILHSISGKDRHIFNIFVKRNEI